MKLKSIMFIICTLLIASVVSSADSLPNLKLTVTHPLSLVKEGSVVHFTIKVKNDGTTASVPCRMAFIESLDIIQWFDVPALAIGTTKTFTYDYTVDCGVQVMIWVDDNKNVESNEGDNSWAKTFECPVIFQNSGIWASYKLVSLKSLKLPAACASCQPWHERLQAGDPVEVLNTIADKILEGKGLAEVEGDWKLFLANNNGLNPRSALEIIFSNAVQKAKGKLSEEGAILSFQKNLNNILLGLHSLSEAALGAK